MRGVGLRPLASSMLEASRSSRATSNLPAGARRAAGGDGAAAARRTLGRARPCPRGPGHAARRRRPLRGAAALRQPARHRGRCRRASRRSSSSPRGGRSRRVAELGRPANLRGRRRRAARAARPRAGRPVQAHRVEGERPAGTPPRARDGARGARRRVARRRRVGRAMGRRSRRRRRSTGSSRRSARSRAAPAARGIAWGWSCTASRLRSWIAPGQGASQAERSSAAALASAASCVDADRSELDEMQVARRECSSTPGRSTRRASRTCARATSTRSRAAPSELRNRAPFRAAGALRVHPARADAAPLSGRLRHRVPAAASRGSGRGRSYAWRRCSRSSPATSLAQAWSTSGRRRPRAPGRRRRPLKRSPSPASRGAMDLPATRRRGGRPSAIVAAPSRRRSTRPCGCAPGHARATRRADPPQAGGPHRARPPPRAAYRGYAAGRTRRCAESALLTTRDPRVAPPRGGAAAEEELRAELPRGRGHRARHRRRRACRRRDRAARASSRLARAPGRSRACWPSGRSSRRRGRARPRPRAAARARARRHARAASWRRTPSPSTCAALLGRPGPGVSPRPLRQPALRDHRCAAAARRRARGRRRARRVHGAGRGRRAARRADPGTKAWGALTVFVRAAFDVRRVLRAPPGAFHPPPEVTSAVVELAPAAPLRAPETEGFRALVRAAFEARRKTLRNAWARLAPDADVPRARGSREGGGVADARGETLDVEAFARMADGAGWRGNSPSAA